MMVGQSSFAQTAEELMPLAIQLEEVNGELEKAIEVYTTIIEKYPENKPFAAKAYFHMGMCYEKLGKVEAQKAYTTLIRDYSEQEDLASEARIRLAALAASADPNLAKGMTIRKVWEGPEVDMWGEVSPDGRYISYVDWDTGDLAIYEIETGKKRRLTSNGSWNDPVEYSLFSRWSPDGKQIVYDWFNDDNPAYIDLYIVGLDGKEPKKLYSNEELQWTHCCDWSSDGKQILAMFTKKDSSNHIGLISTSDGSSQIIKEMSGGKGYLSWPRNMRFSPDSRFIAYDIPADKDFQTRDIHLISTDGSIESTLMAYPSNDYFLGWVPDGTGILFASDRNGGTQSSFFLPVYETKSSGEPTLLKQNMGPADPLGFTDIGSYFYGYSQRLTDIYSAELDPATGEINGPAVKSIRVFEGFNQTPAYSPDGKYLAYVSRRTPVVRQFGYRWGGTVLCIRSLETGKVRELHPDLSLFGYPVWSPDGKSIYLVHWNEDDEIELSGVDAQTGDITLALRHEDRYSHFGGHQFSPSGKMLYYGLRNFKSRDCNIIARDLESGKEETIYSSKQFFTFSLSPDGQGLALGFQGRNNSRLELLSIEGGAIKKLYKFEKGVTLGGAPNNVWSADGNYLLLSVYDSNADSSLYELWRIAVNGGEPEKLGLKVHKSFEGLSVHPDGRHITYSTTAKFVSEIWMMENFLPIAE
jgi:Tol biopolymer transport system component